MSKSTENLEDASRRAVIGGVMTAGALLAASGAAANTLRPATAASATNRDGRFAGRAVVITGATSGIGAATAVAFAREGARVLFCGRREVLGRQVQNAIRENGGEATYRTADVREPAQVQGLLEAAVTQFGRLDILFNNAGIFMTPGEVQDITVENFQDIIATNAGGVFYGMKYAIPHMRRQGGGIIINMASVAGHKGFPNTAAYNASKHAIIGLTKAAATANGKHNIRINSGAPQGLFAKPRYLGRSVNMAHAACRSRAVGSLSER